MKFPHCPAMPKLQAIAAEQEAGGELDNQTSDEGGDTPTTTENKEG